jgi:hypothetical protein
MTSTPADRVALILDCLGHEDTDLLGQARLWRHRDGRYVTEDEAATIGKSTIGEIRRALDLWGEEVEQLCERSQLAAEFRAITSPYAASPGETVHDVIARLPEAKMKRAAEIWQRIGPPVEAWRRDQS